MENRLSVFSLPYFGDISFYSKLKNAEFPVIDIGEFFVKQTQRNRTIILTANGLMKLSVPLLKGKNQKMPMHFVRVCYDSNWNKHHTRAIQSGYSKSPFFDYYFPSILSVLSKKHPYLVDLNLELMELFLKCLKLEVKPEFTKSYINNAFEDFRFQKHEIQSFQTQSYIQVFSDRFEFQNNLSILDLLMNCGPLSLGYL